MARIDKEQARDIFGTLVTLRLQGRLENRSFAILAEEYGVQPQAIKNIWNGRVFVDATMDQRIALSAELEARARSAAEREARLHRDVEAVYEPGLV